MGFRLEVPGLVETRDRLTVLCEQLDDMAPLWERYAEIMAATEAEWFSSNGDGLWPPLAEDTVKDKLAHGYPPETLVRTGLMRDILLDPAQAADISGHEMTYGVTAVDERGRPYAHYHQHAHDVSGPELPYGDRPPERQVIPWPLPVEVEGELLAAGEDWVSGCILRSGLA